MTTFYRLPNTHGMYNASDIILIYCGYHLNHHLFGCKNCPLNVRDTPCYELSTAQRLKILLDKKLIEEVEER